MVERISRPVSSYLRQWLFEFTSKNDSVLAVRYTKYISGLYDFFSAKFTKGHHTHVGFAVRGVGNNCSNCPRTCTIAVTSPVCITCVRHRTHQSKKEPCGVTVIQSKQATITGLTLCLLITVFEKALDCAQEYQFYTKYNRNIDYSSSLLCDPTSTCTASDKM